MVAGTNTGKSPQLTGYYGYWEMAVFNALVLMVLRALEKLHKLLRSSGNMPLFKVCFRMTVVTQENAIQAGLLLHLFFQWHTASMHPL